MEVNRFGRNQESLQGSLQGSKQIDHRIPACIFYASRVSESSHDPRALWRCVKGLLHSNKALDNHEKGMCEKFSTFFNENIRKAKLKMVALKDQLTPSSSIQHQSMSNEKCPTMNALAETSACEVAKLIQKLPSKTSPLDYIHTSVLITA